MQKAKNAVKFAYSRLLWWSGALAAWLRVRPGRGHPWILNYHHVDPGPFESHLRCLQRRYRVVPLDACVAYVTDGRELPRNSVALTFDDGYEQVYTELYPILRRHEAPATVFVATEPVDTGHPLWFNRLKVFLRTTPAATVRIGGLELQLCEGREAAYVRAVAHLNRQTVGARDAMLAELLDGAELPESWMARYRTLTWDQMKTMQGLVTFGAHTRTHPYLSRLSRRELVEEIGGGKARLEAMLGAPVRHFAYPFGGPESFTEDTVDVLRSEGLVSAVTTTRGACRRSACPHRLPRLLLDGSIDGPTMAARLSGLWLFLTT